MSVPYLRLVLHFLVSPNAVCQYRTCASTGQCTPVPHVCQYGTAHTMCAVCRGRISRVRHAVCQYRTPDGSRVYRV
eukprot:2874201-Rhodomonas_salina.1